MVSLSVQAQRVGFVFPKISLQLQELLAVEGACTWVDEWSSRQFFSSLLFVLSALQGIWNVLQRYTSTLQMSVMRRIKPHHQESFRWKQQRTSTVPEYAEAETCEYWEQCKVAKCYISLLLDFGRSLRKLVVCISCLASRGPNTCYSPSQP